MANTRILLKNGRANIKSLTVALVAWCLHYRDLSSPISRRFQTDKPGVSLDWLVQIHRHLGSGKLDVIEIRCTRHLTGKEARLAHGERVGDSWCVIYKRMFGVRNNKELRLFPRRHSAIPGHSRIGPEPEDFPLLRESLPDLVRRIVWSG